jgi:hypothetical protein
VTSIRVFVNATAVDVPKGARAIDCVRAWKPEEADAVIAGKRAITDSRGLEVDASTATAAGSIFRTISKRPAPA